MGRAVRIRLHHPPTSLRFEGFSWEVRKLRACSGDAHGPSAPESAHTSSRAPSLPYSLCGRVVRCRCRPLANATSGQELRYRERTLSFRSEWVGNPSTSTHSEQNFLSPGFSEPQFEQGIEVTSENGTIGFSQVHPFFAATILYQGTIVPPAPRLAEYGLKSREWD